MPVPSGSAAVPPDASRTTTTYAAWLTITNSAVQIPSRRVCPRPAPRKSKRGRIRTPADRR